MIQEALAYLIGVGRDNTDFKRTVAPNGDVLIRSPDGSITEYPYYPPDRNHVTEDIDSFVSMISQFGHDTVVMIDREGARAVLHQKDRRDELLLSLPLSNEWNALARLSKQTLHKSFVQTLKKDLRDCVDETFIATMQRIDFKRRNDGSRSIEHGKESLGNSVESAVQSAGGEIPEYLRASIPWFANRDLRKSFEVQCYLQIDSTEEKLTLSSVGSSIETAGQEALAYAQQEIRESLALGESTKDVPVVLASR